MRKVVRIDALPESAWRYSAYDAIVCIDVLLASTTIVTAIAQGRRVFAASSPVQALWFNSRVEDAFVVTDSLAEAEGKVRFGGPAWLAAQEDHRARAIVHVSPLAEMMSAAMPRAAVYVACLRNLEATADALARRHARVAILGAGERGEVCTEDQMAAAWLAARLQVRGFEIEGHHTATEMARWGQPDQSLVGWSRSAERLRARGHGADVTFVLRHRDDLNVVATYAGGEVRNPAAPPAPIDDEDEDARPTPAWGTTLPILGH